MSEPTFKQILNQAIKADSGRHVQPPAIQYDHISKLIADIAFYRAENNLQIQSKPVPKVTN